MAIPITKTKLTPPRRRSDLLTRQRLLDLLDSFKEYRLIILAAPAGYGKTTLLVDYLQRADLQIAWLSLDSLDKNPQRFLAHLAAAINLAFPLFGGQVNSAIDKAIFDLDEIVPAFVNDIYTHIKTNFLLVVDDFHLVAENEIIERFVNRFIQEVDENCHLILASRSLLTLPDLPLMVARQQVAGLSFEELAFQPPEIQSLLLQNYHKTISEETAAELVQETEGWITGLVLSAQTMWQGMTRQVQAAKVSGVGLYEYLIQQVLDLQEPDVQNFLMRTSFLEEFDAGLCQDVFGPGQDWEALMGEALINNLFIQPIGDEGHWVRYHHLFRDFLQTHYQQQHPEETNQILHLAASAYTRREEWEKAYAFYRRLEDLAGQLDLIEKAGSAFLGGGRLAILADWIDMLPSDVLSSRPAILSLRGAVQIMQGKNDLGLETLTQVVTQLEREQAVLLVDQPAVRLQAEVLNPLLARTLARRSVGYRFNGQYKQAIDDAQRALQLVEGLPNQDTLRAEAFKSIGLSERSNGQVALAIADLTKALQRFQSVQDQENIAVAHMDLGLAYMSAARYNLALDHYRQALVYWQQTRNLVGQANLFNNLGVLYQLMGDAQRAIIHFEEAFESAVQCGYARMQAYIYCGIGDLYGDLGAAHAARQAYLLAEDFANQLKYKYLLIYIGLASADLARRQRECHLARLLLDRIDPLVQTNGSAADRAAWHFQQGLLNLANDEPSVAIDDLKYAGWYFSESGQRIEAALALFALAVARYRNQESGEAWIEFEHAIQQTLGVQNHQKLVLAATEFDDFLEAASRAPAVANQAAQLLESARDYLRVLPTLRRRIRPHIHTVRFLPPKLSIRTLGGSQVSIDGKPVSAAEWQPQVRELFFRLLSEPHGQTREEIGLILWPELAGSDLTRRFKNVIYKLRSALPDDTILYEGDLYRFNPDLDYEYDVEVFISYTEIAENPDTPESQIAALQAAVAAYGGTFLIDLDGTWVIPERERLHLRFIDAGLRLAHLLMDKEDQEAARETCRLVLNQDRTQEAAHRLLMQVYASQGNRAAVVRQYEECRQALKSQLGTTPSPQTQRLYQILTNG